MHVRRVERELRDSYSALIARLTAELTSGNYDTAVAAADAADLVRGYEDVKLANVERYRERLTQLRVAER
jgi:indolepyruvate ferredoxin oxidoreductase